MPLRINTKREHCSEECYNMWMYDKNNGEGGGQK